MGRVRSKEIVFALVMAIGAGTVAWAAEPAAHVVRIDRPGDERLDGLAAVVRAELRAAGFKVAPNAGLVGASTAATAPAVITLKLDGARALVVAPVDGAAAPFSGAVALAEGGAPAARDVNRVALQVAEWLAAIWLPPPPPSPRASAPLAVAAAPVAPPSAAVVEPQPAGPVEPVVPPPFAAAAAPPSTPALPAATLLAASSSPPAAPRRALADLDFGAGVLRVPDFGTQFGFELGTALHGTSPIVAGATPFARLVLGLYWLGSGIDLPVSNQEFDLNFASVTAAAGLRWSVFENVAVEASAGFGLTLVWLASPQPSGGLAFRIYPSNPSDGAWVSTPGGALALVNRLSQRWAVAGEVRASWMVPGLVVETNAARTGGSHWPMLAGTLALRITL
jgi:hypothetical protein